MADRIPTKGRFTAFVHAYKSKILPLLGDEKVADLLEEEVNDAEIYEYERLHDQPAGVKAQLKPHQLDGVSFLSYLRMNNAHGIIGDEMGLGKTLQILSFFQLVKSLEKGDNRPFFVICPLSVLAGWQIEIDTWTNLKAIQWYGSGEKRRSTSQIVKNQDFDVVLTTYETVVADKHRLSRLGTWKCVVLDEGHRIKNFTTKLSAAVKSLKTDQRLILTGTPIQNDLSEVWSMCNWLYPELFVKETQQYWRDAFSLSDGTVDSTFLEDVREFLGVIMLRRLKQSTSAGLEIPAKKEVILHLPLTQEQKRLYLEVITGCVDFVEDSANDDSSYALQTPPASPGSEGFTRSHSTNQNARGKRSGLSVTNTLMELRKVCIHPLLVDNMEKGDDDDEAMIRGLVDFSSKFIALERLVDQEVVRNNKKMLIFSGFDYALDCCQSLLSAMNISHLRLDGSTPHAMRRFAVHQFQKKDEHRVFVIATKAGGEGITLTAAEVVVFLDLDWNPQVMAQAEARAHRIGQERPVTVVKLCTRGTVEHQMLNRVNKKLYLASKVINDVAAGNSEISISEPFESDDTFIHRLISHSFTPKPVDSFTADQLIKMDWGEIVKSCQHTSDADDHEHTSPVTTPPSPGVDTFDEQEKLWLSQSTKIRTGLFNGTIFSRPRAALKVDILADLDPSKRRLGKNRRVYDPEIGYYVDKMSTLCKYGEAVSPMTKVKTSKLKTVFTNGFEHLKTCMICAKPKKLEECMYCPQAYHKECVDRQKESSRNNPFHNAVCTKHSCVRCGLTANKVGGLLLSCTDCPCAYCIDCVDLNALKSIDGELPEYRSLGYNSPRHIQYITCGGCVQKAQEGERKRRVTASDDRILRSIKRARGFVLE